jgi:hypothetical protein
VKRIRRQVHKHERAVPVVKPQEFIVPLLLVDVRKIDQQATPAA